MSAHATTHTPGTRPAPAATILVVEDDRSLREGLLLNLKLHGYDVLGAADGEQGMRLAFDARPDLIILDIMLPVWSGLDILGELRSRGEQVPVLILSAKNSTANKVTGLQLGADDYLTKPFDLLELLARVEAMLRRHHTDTESHPPLTVGDLSLDTQARSLTCAGQPVTLSAKEFDILRLLMDAPGKVFSRDAILEQVWGWDYEGTARTVDNYIATLRKKLRRGRTTRTLIRTIPKVGYALETPAAREA